MAVITMVLTSSAPQKKRKSAFSAWFGAGLEEEAGEASYEPYLWEDDDDDDGDEPEEGSGSARRRLLRNRSRSKSVDRPKSAIALSQANKPRLRTLPLKRSSLDFTPGPSQLLRVSGQNNTPVILPSKKREPPNQDETFFDAQSGQSSMSSMTNSWVPKFKHYHPFPCLPHKPLENMVITIHNNKPGGERDAKEEAGKGGDDMTYSTALSSSHSTLHGGPVRHKVELLHGVEEAGEHDDIQNNGSSGCLQSLALTKEQKAEVEQYVFRGWGSDDEGEVGSPVVQEEAKKSRQTSWFFKRTKGSISSQNSVAGDDLLHSTPHSTPHSAPHSAHLSIENAMQELQELTGMQVRCLDESGAITDDPDTADNDNESHSTVRFSKTRAASVVDEDCGSISLGDCEEIGKEKQEEHTKSGWFFGSGRKPNALIDEEDELAQPYALIRSEEDEARLKKHFKEEERLRMEEEKRLDDEKKKKRGSWFFSTKEEDSPLEEVLDDKKMADALDDLEIFAGETRVSQVKRARLLEKEGIEHRYDDGDEQDNVDPLDQVQRSFGRNALPASQTRKSGQESSSNAVHGMFRSPVQENISPELANHRRFLSDKQKRSLSRFELPLETAEDEDAPGYKQRYQMRTRSLDELGGATSKRHFTNSCSSIGELRNVKEESSMMQISPDDLVSEDRRAQDNDSVIDDSTPWPPKAADLKKQALIVDLAKRDLRWHLNQTLVNSLFKSYHSSMAKIDDLLPSEDAFNIFEDIGESVEEQFREVRDKMLEDGNLSEREVASFFQGFALLAVKARSLQSQLDSFKAVSRAQAEERQMQDLSRDTLLNEDIIKEAPRIMLIKSLQADSNATSETKVLLKQLEANERKRIKLEKELLEHGAALPEHIPFEEAKGKVERISQKIGDIRSKDARHLTKKKQTEQEEELATLENEVEKYETALTMSGTWVKAEEKWEADNAEDNLEALRRIRRHMPVNVKSLNEDQLTIETTPNGKLLPRRIAKKFKQATILQLVRTHPDDIDGMHPSILENLQTIGLTLSERRAIYSHLKLSGLRWRVAAEEPTTNRKWLWFRMLKQEFKEALDVYQRHCEEFGPPDNHPYAIRANATKGCQLVRKQCPVKADKMFDYAVDYGFPEGEVYEDGEGTSHQKQMEAMDFLEAPERIILKKALRRSELLKSHCKGRVLQVALANDSCEAMDRIMDRMETLQDRWIEDRLRHETARFTDMQRSMEMGFFASAVDELKVALPLFAERSGMQLTGNTASNAAQPDDRSLVELELCEEVWEHADDFFAGIDFRLKELGTRGAVAWTRQPLHFFIFFKR